jgi:hypothetical protein
MDACYLNLGDLAQVALGGPVEDAARGLVECVRLLSGALQDDVAVIVGGVETGTI